MNIRDEIVEQRKIRIQREGHSLGGKLPAVRQEPVIPFGREPFLICEVKRRSPSKGDIAPGLDAAAQAGIYVNAGVSSVSVLTEEDFFGGSLRDLLFIKEKYPDTALLRKDFLLDPDDIHISHRAGADAVLLIAGMLSAEMFREMYSTACELGMACLVEVHTPEDIEKVRSSSPRYVGINSRNLETFSVDKLHPMGIAGLIDWDTERVFESGISSGEDAVTALDGGFTGLLVGEGVVTNRELIGELLSCFFPERNKRPGFWREIAEKLRGRKGDGRGVPRPLVKICGITNREDAEAACALGADILGFVFAESPRKADLKLPRELQDIDVVKTAVVTGGPGGIGGELESELKTMLRDGIIDAVQFHGDEEPESCFPSAYPYYKAVRCRSPEDIQSAKRYRSPRVLFDAYSSKGYGGTGRTIGDGLLSLLPKDRLWLAGGLGPDSIRSVMKRCSPELVDASSLLEAYPGKKDYRKLKRFFEEIDHGLE